MSAVANPILTVARDKMNDNHPGRGKLSITINELVQCIITSYSPPLYVKFIYTPTKPYYHQIIFSVSELTTILVLFLLDTRNKKFGNDIHRIIRICTSKSMTFSLKA